MAGQLWLLQLGLVEYGTAYALQRHFLEERAAERMPDLLILVEHPPVFTLGRRASRADVYAPVNRLVELGIAVHETNRGGLVTYHGPGQIVAYPITRLRSLAGNATAYVRGLEETVIRSLADFGVMAHRDDANRGVFAQGGKIAAIGVAVSRGVTMHGLALNVRPDLGHFDLINPCGLAHLGVTSVERILGRRVNLLEVRRALARHFADRFERSIESVGPRFLHDLGQRFPTTLASAACSTVLATPSRKT